MESKKPQPTFAITFAVTGILLVGALILAGCNSMNGTVGSIVASTTAVPVSITDAPNDQVLAATLTLDSVVLTDSSAKTTSILSSPMTFEATHLDAVQEPLITPAVPEDTYVSATLTYSNAQIAYVDPTTKQVMITTATLANTSQTVTFSAPITISSTSTGLLVDYLVDKSVTISGTTVTVSPDFNIAVAPIAAAPTNGMNGLMCGVRGKVTALGTNSFTVTTGDGATLTINVNSNTVYQGLTGFSALAVNALVEVDIKVQTDGSLLAVRVEEQIAPNATAQMLIGPVTSVTGSPATSFTMLVRQEIGGASTAAVGTQVTVTVSGTTQFVLPGRFTGLVLEDALGETFSASTIFAGQVVGVATSDLSGTAATAQGVGLSPQTVDGTIASITQPSGTGPGWEKVVVTLNSGSWLETLTGQTSVTVLLPAGLSANPLQAINSSTLAVGDTARYNGFLFDDSGTLTLVGLVQAPGPGTPLAPPPL